MPNKHTKKQFIDQLKFPDISNKLITFLFLLFAILFSFFVLSGIFYYFDTVPYVATTLMADISNPAELHKATYELLQQRLSPEQFTPLVSGPYGLDLYQNSQNFYSQLDLYLIKPLYVFFLRSLYLLGVNPLDALLITSLIPALGILCIFFIWLKKYLLPLQALILTITLSSAARLIDLTQGLVHNNLSSFFLIAAMYILVVKKREWMTIILLCFSILIRTDNIIFVSLILAWLIWSHIFRFGLTFSRELNIRICGLIAAVGIYFSISTIYGHGWWFLFYHSLIESQVNVDNFNIPFSFSLYFSVVSNAAATIFSSGFSMASILPIFILMTLVAIPAKNWKLETNQLIKPSQLISPIQLVLLSIPVLIAYLLLFPLVSAWDRLFTHFYVLYVIAVAYNISNGEIRKSKGSE